MGSACAALTRIDRRSDHSLVAVAAASGAALWIIGIGSRMAFGIFAEHGGGPAIVRFDTTHHLSAFDSYTAALILMSLVEVLSRSVVLSVRGHHVPLQPQAEPKASPPVLE
ncbi:MAG: hypothetical protein H0V07_06705 [Propionibacteriales bacterium]|nr:hypothetical protein [Propionibacteriales bacterium]